jgi:hypothetical protein
MPRSRRAVLVLAEAYAALCAFTLVWSQRELDVGLPDIQFEKRTCTSRDFTPDVATSNPANRVG